MMLKLSKQIPARTKTVEFDWCQKDYTKMSQMFRNIRSQLSNKMDSCFWCKHKFADGEMMALAGKKTGNVMLCQECAGILEEDDRGGT